MKSICSIHIDLSIRVGKMRKESVSGEDKGKKISVQTTFRWTINCQAREIGRRQAFTTTRSGVEDRNAIYGHWLPLPSINRSRSK